MKPSKFKPQPVQSPDTIMDSGQMEKLLNIQIPDNSKPSSLAGTPIMSRSKTMKKTSKKDRNQKTSKSFSIRQSIFGKKKVVEAEESKQEENETPNLQQDNENEEDSVDENEEEEDEEKKKQNERQFQREIDDFFQCDKDERNIFHRACADQQIKLIQDILQEFTTVLESTEPDPQKRQLKTEEYLNKPDKFKCTPLLICCYMNLSSSSDKSGYTPRYACLVDLVRKGAKVNTMNPRSKWSPLHWCCQYGDQDSVKFLIEKGILAFLPDFDGYYPIDLAGRIQNKGVVEILLRHLLQLLIDFEQFKEGIFHTEDIIRLDFIKDITKKYEKWLKNPILRCKLLYWTINFSFELKYVKLIVQLARTYYLAPMESEFRKTSLHTASEQGNLHVVEFLFSYQQEWYDREDIQGLQTTLFKYSYESNKVLPFTYLEHKNEYRKSYCDQVLRFANWEMRYIQKRIKALGIKKIKPSVVPLIGQVVEKPAEIIDIDQADLYGNSALHQASLKGHSKIVQTIIKYGGNMEKENKELFKARELTQHKEVLALYQQLIRSTDQDKVIEELNGFILHSLEELFSTDKKNSEELAITQQLRDRTHDVEYKQKLKDMFSYSNELFVPDFVLKSKLNEIKKSAGSPSFFDLLKDDSAELQRFNFQISLLQNAKFEIYIMKSYSEEGYYYIMLRHREENLEIQAQLMQLQVKLMESFDLEPFQTKYQALFEPFRSRQRQQIIEAHLKRIMNLQELIQAKVLDCCYRMHTFGGIAKIKQQWIEKSLWYWPQPLNQLDDYLKEGSTQNFTSITILRLYFGEKISFFFAWKSFLTCILLPLALPGLALQIYIIYYNDYSPGILPFWVGYVCLWSTVQVELWKRKTSEINTRWGQLDLVQDEEIQNTKIREEFSGDEEIYQVTGELTKHQKQAETLIKLLISIPILSFFIGLCVLTFVGIDSLIQKNKADQTLVIGLGVLQGIGITILNMIYTYIATWFAYNENHKFQEKFEGSMIYKNAAFKFLNSYLSIFYACFVRNDSTLQTIFQLMLPVLIVKQINYMLLEVLLPQLIYKLKERQYFNRQLEIIHRQDQLKMKQEEGQEEHKTYKDMCEQFWSFVFKRKLPSSQRAVLKIQSEQEQVQEKSKHDGFYNEQKISLVCNMDADAVELNSIKLDFEGTLNYFMEGMIDMGYITLFAAAFPIGPFIALIANIMEIKMKMFSFLYVYKRPQTQRCSGIGEWMNVMEVMSLISVFTNFALLYIKQRKSTIESVYQYKTYSAELNGGVEHDTPQAEDEWAVWFFLISVVLLVGFKQIAGWAIPDRPEWVQRELERMSHKSALQSGNAETVKHTQSKLQEIQQKLDKAKHVYDSQKISYQKQIKAKEDYIEKVNHDIEHEIKLKQIDDDLKDKKGKILQTIGTYKFTTKSDYELTIKGIFKLIIIDIIIGNGMSRQSIYYLPQDQARLQILIPRLYLFVRLIRKINFMQDCGNKEATFECENCDEAFCEGCFFTLHDVMKKEKHTVILTKPLNCYDPNKLTNMHIQRRPNQKDKKEKIKFDSSMKITDHPKRWKKFQYFTLPTTKQGEFFKYLQKLFKLFQQEYIEDNGIVDDCYELKLDKVFKYTQLSKQSALSESDIQSQFTTIDSARISKILDMSEFNIEDKLFLNRIAFLVFKKYKSKSSFEDFFKYCVTLQDGLIEQKVLLLLDLVDTNDDGEITKNEIEKIFISSFVQDTDCQDKVQDMVTRMFAQHQESYTKKDALNYIIGSLTDNHIRSFISALVQEKHK